MAVKYHYDYVVCDNAELPCVKVVRRHQDYEETAIEYPVIKIFYDGVSGFDQGWAELKAEGLVAELNKLSRFDDSPSETERVLDELRRARELFVEYIKLYDYVGDAIKEIERLAALVRR